MTVGEKKKMEVLVTGAKGFVGRNLCIFLKQLEDLKLIEVDLDTPPDVLEKGLEEAEIIFHLAGVNRPEKTEDYKAGNAQFTENLCARLTALQRTPLIIFSSSIQAAFDNPYGVSKLDAEDTLKDFSSRTGSRVIIFRMKNVFGKWCRPNYNSVVATFCHNIARSLPIHISDPANEVQLVYIDDVCAAMMEAAGLSLSTGWHFSDSDEAGYGEINPHFRITLGELANMLKGFRESRISLEIPRFDDPFTRRLYSTYLSYLEERDFAYHLDIKGDDRGNLAEFIKSPSVGQVFVSNTKPGITRGNHYHHTKTEKFLVVKGEAIIRLRHIQGDKVIEYRVEGREFNVVDIPPGYTHAIENAGNEDLVTIFWADEVFDPNCPDTYYMPVLKEAKK